jgi:hypothetical protein
MQHFTGSSTCRIYILCYGKSSRLNQTSFSKEQKGTLNSVLTFPYSGVYMKSGVSVGLFSTIFVMLFIAACFAGCTSQAPAAAPPAAPTVAATIAAATPAATAGNVTAGNATKVNATPTAPIRGSGI